MSGKWVQSWGQAHSALSFFYYPECKMTFRMVVNTAVSGKKLRVRLSNICGKNAVGIGCVTAAPCNKNGMLTGKPVDLTFNGRQSLELAKGERAVSDEADFTVEAGEYMCISLYAQKGSLTSGNLLSNVNLLTAKGNRTHDTVIENEPRVRDSVRGVACKVLGMFFHKPIPVFEGVELFNDTGAGAVVVFGDSISQQGFWTNELDKRVRECYPGRYSVINKAIMGNRLLKDYSPRFICKGLFGEAGRTRIKRDVYDWENVEYVLYALGINDFLQYGTITTPKSEKPDVGEFCREVKKMSEEVRSRGMKFILLTVLGFGGSGDYRPEKEVLRQEANKWLRENSELFDGVFDWAQVMQSPVEAHLVRQECLGADKLHLNEYGGEYVASRFDMNLLS